MNKALKNILERNSHRNLVDPIPSKDEMEQVFQAALRAPDHAWVRPSSFIQVSGEGLQKLSDTFVEVAKESFEDLTDDKMEKYKNVDVIKLDKLTVEHAKELEAKVMLRGLRAVSDFEYEVQLSTLNRAMNPGKMFVDDYVEKKLREKVN